MTENNTTAIIDNDSPEGEETATLPPHFDCLGPELHLTETQTTLGTDDDGNHLMVANITVKGVPSIVRTLLANLLASPFALLLISDPEFSIYAAAASEGRLGIADDEEEEEADKPKRGRPRKQQPTQAPPQNMAGLSDGEAPEEPVKRGPGRPRKHPLPVDAAPAPAPAQAAAAPAVVDNQASLFDDELEPTPAPAPAVNTAQGFNPPADILAKPRVGDVIRWLAQDAHSKGVTMQQAIPQIHQWFLDNHTRVVALRISSVEQVASTMSKSLEAFVTSNWPKS